MTLDDTGTAYGSFFVLKVWDDRIEDKLVLVIIHKGVVKYD